MTTDDEDEIVIPALLRAARGSYGGAIRRELAAAGFDDLPRNSAYVLGGAANHGIPVGQLTAEIGMTKQAASQLLDALVLRGYLERSTDPADGRRMTIQLTERGRAAGTAVRDGVVAVDEELAQRCTPEQIAGLRAGLVALCDIRERMEAEEG
jgi:DNA-binding MarR family transcriptional regulator